jgi:hypothetical protein
MPRLLRPAPTARPPPPPPATANVDFIVASLQAVKANHEVKVINPSTSSTGRPNWQAMFYNADGTGRYRGIFM